MVAVNADALVRRTRATETLAASKTQGRPTHQVARSTAQERVHEAMVLRGRVPETGAHKYELHPGPWQRNRTTADLAQRTMQ